MSDRLNIVAAQPGRLSEPCNVAGAVYDASLDFSLRLMTHFTRS